MNRSALPGHVTEVSPSHLGVSKEGNAVQPLPLTESMQKVLSMTHAIPVLSTSYCSQWHGLDHDIDKLPRAFSKKSSYCFSIYWFWGNIIWHLVFVEPGNQERATRCLLLKSPRRWQPTIEQNLTHLVCKDPWNPPTKHITVIPPILIRSGGGAQHELTKSLPTPNF